MARPSLILKLNVDRISPKMSDPQVGWAHKSRYIVNSNSDAAQVQALMGLSLQQVRTTFARAMTMYGQCDYRSYAPVCAANM